MLRFHCVLFCCFFSSALSCGTVPASRKQNKKKTPGLVVCKGSRFFYNFSLRLVFFSFLVKMETQTKFVRPEKKKAVARAHSVQQSRGHSLSRAHSLTGEKQRRPMAHTQQQQQSRAELLLSFVSFRSKKKKNSSAASSSVYSWWWRDLEEEEEFYDYYRSKAAEFLNAAEQQRREERRRKKKERLENKKKKVFSFFLSLRYTQTVEKEEEGLKRKLLLFFNTL